MLGAPVLMMVGLQEAPQNIQQCGETGFKCIYQFVQQWKLSFRMKDRFVQNYSNGLKVLKLSETAPPAEIACCSSVGRPRKL
jgi:hypothetical protein